MTLKGTLRQSLWLWHEGHEGVDGLAQATRLRNCQIAVDLFLDGKLSLNDFLEIVEAQGVNMDEYLKIVDNNLKFSGIV